MLSLAEDVSVAGFLQNPICITVFPDMTVAFDKVNGKLARFGFRLCFSAFLKEYKNDGGVFVVPSRMMQRGRAPAILRADAGAGFNERPDYLGVCVARSRMMQRGRARAVLRADVGAGFNERPDCLRVCVARSRIMQRGRALEVLRADAGAGFNERPDCLRVCVARSRKMQWGRAKEVVRGDLALPAEAGAGFNERPDYLRVRVVFSRKMQWGRSKEALRVNAGAGFNERPDHPRVCVVPGRKMQREPAKPIPLIDILSSQDAPLDILRSGGNHERFVAQFTGLQGNRPVRAANGQSRQSNQQPAQTEKDSALAPAWKRVFSGVSHEKRCLEVIKTLLYGTA